MPVTNANLPVRAHVPRLEVLNAVCNFREVGSAFDRICNGGEEDIGISFLHVLNSRFDIAKLLALVAPHQKHSSFDSVRFAHSYRGSYFFSGDAPFHSIQDALRAALGADPHAKASHFSEGCDNLRTQPVGARNTFKRQLQSPPLKFGGVLKEPTVVNGEDVIGHPSHFGLVSTN